MSVAEQSGGPGPAFGAQPWDPEVAGFSAPVAARPEDRMPPQDNAAEQSVLGSMLLSKDAIADVVETIRGADFYRPAHETVFDAVKVCVPSTTCVRWPKSRLRPLESRMATAIGRNETGLVVSIV